MKKRLKKECLSDYPDDEYAAWGNIAPGILHVIQAAKMELPLHKIVDGLADLEIYPKDNTVRVTVSHLCARGLIENTGKHACAECGSSKSRYRLTDAGRQKLWWNNGVPGDTLSDMVDA